MDLILEVLVTLVQLQLLLNFQLFKQQLAVNQVIILEHVQLNKMMADQVQVQD
jgi:hypothetical protein